MWNDPIIDEIHKQREEHVAKFNYDVHAIYEDWKREESELRKQGWKFASPPQHHVNEPDTSPAP